MKTLKNVLTLFLATFLWIGCSNNEDSSSSSNCDTVCSYTLASGESAGTLPVSLDGTYTLTYHSAQTGSPFTDGTVAVFTVSNNGLSLCHNIRPYKSSGGLI